MLRTVLATGAGQDWASRLLGALGERGCQQVALGGTGCSGVIEHFSSGCLAIAWFGVVDGRGAAVARTVRAWAAARCDRSGDDAV